MIYSTKPDHRETVLGCIYLAVYLFVLPGLLSAVNSLLPEPLSSGKLNFVYYCVNFLAVAVIFRRYLLQSIRDFLPHPFYSMWCSLLGYMGNLALGQIAIIVIVTVYPRFANINDLSVALALRQELPLMAVGTILLVPVAEEVLFRGLIFRGLYDRSPAAAYLVSMAAFSSIHVIGYIGTVDPILLLLSFVQYLPAGYCLAFTYRRSGTLLSPILMHAIVNAMAVYSMR